MTAMPLYEYKCRTCENTFDLRRSMSEANEPATCPQGHPGAVRLLSVFASVGGSATGGAAASQPAGGCGSGCGCAH